MMLCKKCSQVTARVITKRELSKLSKNNYSGAVVATAAAVATVAAKTGGSGITSAVRYAAKAATKGPRELLIAAGITAALGVVSAGVKYLYSKREAGDKSYVYCASCGHYEPMS